MSKACWSEDLNWEGPKVNNDIDADGVITRIFSEQKTEKIAKLEEELRRMTLEKDHWFNKYCELASKKRSF